MITGQVLIKQNSIVKAYKLKNKNQILNLIRI